MTIHRLITGRMPQEDKQTVVRIVACSHHGTSAGCANGRPNGHRDVDADVRFVRNAGPHLSPGHEALNVQGPMGWHRCPRLVFRGSTRSRGPDRDGPHRRDVVGSWGRVVSPAEGAGGGGVFTPS